MPRSTALVTVLLTMSLSSCGGGDSGSQANSASLPPPLATESPAQLAAIAAFSSPLNTPSHFLTAASATLSWDYMYAGSRARNECPISGFQQILLDGAAWTARFPVGKHTLAAQFQSCKFAGPMQDLLLSGSVEMADLERLLAARLSMGGFKLNAAPRLPNKTADGLRFATVARA